MVCPQNFIFDLWVLYRSFPFVETGEKFISPWHDIPLWVDRENAIANMIVEIPKGSWDRLYIAQNEYLNPLRFSFHVTR